MPIHLEDKLLVKRVLAGEERAFNQFFDENFGRLYRFVLPRVSHDGDAASEIVQAAMSRGMQKLRGYRGEAALFTWLCSIARNELVDWMRRQSRYRRHVVLIEDSPEIRAAVDSFQLPAVDGPGSRYQKHEIARLIHVALDSLPPKYGDVLEWKYIQGYSVKEIAQRMELSPVAVQSLLARAKQAFHEVYGSLVQPLLEEAQS